MVAIGGGTGLASLLRGLKSRVGQEIGDLTAVVTVADDGGSSGRLRRDFGVLPPGDIRNCIVALADDEALLARLFQYRFETGDGLSGHSFGNLFLTALAGVTGDFYQAILTAESILSVRGRILPATLGDVRLRGAGLSGRIYEGESAVGSSGERLASLELEPADAEAFGPAVDALLRADLIVLGPGSLYTSVLPNLLIPGIRRAVRESSARVVLVLNLMTQPGETDQMNALEHLEALETSVGPGLIDVILGSSALAPRGLLELYEKAGSQPVAIEGAALAARRVELVLQPLLSDDPEHIRHDPERLCEAILEIAAASSSRPSIRKVLVS